MTQGFTPVTQVFTPIMYNRDYDASIADQQTVVNQAPEKTKKQERAVEVASRRERAEALEQAKHRE
jgi:hypothetical protein